MICVAAKKVKCKNVSMVCHISCEKKREYNKVLVNLILQNKYYKGKSETKEVGYLRGWIRRDGAMGMDSRDEEGVIHTSILFCIVLTLRTIVMFNLPKT